MSNAFTGLREQNVSDMLAGQERRECDAEKKQNDVRIVETLVARNAN